MLKDLVMIGDRIEVRMLDQHGEVIKHGKASTSQLLDIIDESLISIAVPISNGILVMLHQGIDYQLCFYSVKGPLRCTCTVIDTYKENNTRIAKVKITSEIMKFQRREFFRLEMLGDMKYRMILPLEDELKKRRRYYYSDPEMMEEIDRKLEVIDSEWYRASIVDLSGGGVKFTSEQQLIGGDSIYVKFDFILGSEDKNFKIEAKVIASEKSMNIAGKYVNRVTFTDISDKNREALIKYIFTQERLQRKRNG